MSKKVVILGGGVAGMSAAQELAERNFEVVVFEKQEIPGGKARSIRVVEPFDRPTLGGRASGPPARAAPASVTAYWSGASPRTSRRPYR